jgi:DNA primase
VSKYDISNPNEKQKALKEANHYLKTQTPIMQDEYARYLASKLNIRQNLISTQSKQINKSYQKNQNLSQIDIAELEIIKTVLENPESLDLVLNTIDKSMFKTHSEEFDMLLNDKQNPLLRGILLNEDIKIYSQEQLKDMLLKLLIVFYKEKLELIKYDKNIVNKSVIIRKVQENIIKLRKGELVPFDII